MGVGRRGLKRRRKKAKTRGQREKERLLTQKEKQNAAAANSENKNDEIEIEYITTTELDENDPNYEEYLKIFSHFQEKKEEEIEEEEEVEEEVEKKENTSDIELSTEIKPLSNREKKRQRRLGIAALKQLVPKPEVVEVHDANSNDPLFLVTLKSVRNSVPVPMHWGQKRKYLQGKRGIEKNAFELPEFIQATGISKIRAAMIEKEEQKKLKQKAREKMQPKLGKMDIDYQVLHDAFFKYQTKPRLTNHGDLYFEGKEFEVSLRERKPGNLSDDLKLALGMPEGSPPPWLVNMQRYGPPPSYPNLKIAGVNAPIPEGCQYGYHAGGWGKPPVDEFGRPLYGDVFGAVLTEAEPEIIEEIEREHFGELEADNYDDYSDDESEEESEEEDDIMEDNTTNYITGTESVTTGLETPATIELRKKQEQEIPSTEIVDYSDKHLYQVLEEQDGKVGGAIFGSSKKYVDPRKVDLMKSQKTQSMQVTLDPAEIEQMETEGNELLKRKFDQAMEVSKTSQKKEDMSDLVSEHISKTNAKERKKKSKYNKDFRF